MEHDDHVDLLRDGIAPGVWADLGSGRGAFTLALADLLGPKARIHSVDRDQRSLREQRQAMEARFPEARVDYVEADFTRPLGLGVLDGVVMANSLHFVRLKENALALIRAAVRPGGRLVLVEYDTDRGNHWVPYPVSFPSWERVAAAAGFTGTRRLHRVGSRWLGAIYSALSINPP